MILLVMWLATGALYFIPSLLKEVEPSKKRATKDPFLTVEMGMTKAREYLDSHNSSGPGYVPIMIIFSHVGMKRSSIFVSL